MFFFFQVCPINNQLNIACKASRSLSTVSMECLLECLSHLASTTQAAWLFDCKPLRYTAKVLATTLCTVPLQNTTKNTSIDVQSSDLTCLLWAPRCHSVSRAVPHPPESSRCTSENVVQCFFTRANTTRRFTDRNTKRGGERKRSGRERED